MNKQTMYSVKSGFLITIAGTLLMLILLFLNFVGPESVKNDKLMVGGTILFISLYVFLLLGIYTSISKVKKITQNLTFKNAFITGFVVSLSTAIFSVLFTILFYELIYPDYNADMATVLTEKLTNQNLSEIERTEKINEQTNQKKDEKKVAQIGYNFLQKKARGSAGAKELLNIVQKNKRKIKRKSKGGIKIEIQTTFPRNKLNHFRDSLKKDKKNNTLSPRNLQRNAQMGSETSGELIQMSTGDDFISSKMKKAISRIQNTSRAGSFEQSKKLQERRNKKFFEKNRIKSLNHQKANKEVKLALKLVEGNLKEIETIRKSGLREKTARSLSKKKQ